MTAAMEPALVDPAYARQLTDRIKTAVSATWELIKEAYVHRAWDALGYGSWDDYCTAEFGTSRLRLPREERTEVVGSLRDAGLSLRAIASATGDSYGTVRRALDSGEPNGSPDPDPAPAIDVCPHCGNDLEDGQVCAGCYPPADDPIERIHALPDFPEDDDEPALTDEECRALADPDDLDDEPEPEQRITGSDGKSYPATKPTKKPNRKPITDAARDAGEDLRKVVQRIERLIDDDRFTRNREEVAARLRGHLIYAVDSCQGFLDRFPSA